AELPSGTEQLLVVDDDPLQQTMIAEMLRMLGYQVSTAGSGEAALEIARERPPRLAILDMLLGDGIDGAETYCRLCDAFPGQRAVLLSGFAETDRVRLAQSRGAGPYVRKPVGLDHLALVVRQVLDAPIA